MLTYLHTYTPTHQTSKQADGAPVNISSQVRSWGAHVILLARVVSNKQLNCAISTAVHNTTCLQWTQRTHTDMPHPRTNLSRKTIGRSCLARKLGTGSRSGASLRVGETVPEGGWP